MKSFWSVMEMSDKPEQKNYRHKERDNPGSLVKRNKTDVVVEQVCGDLRPIDMEPGKG